MSLEQIVDNTRTDKNTTHSYLPLYGSLFKDKKETTQNILEIGIQNGGSIKLWRDYFINATIYGLDIICVKHGLRRIWREIWPGIRAILKNSVA